MTQYVPAEVYKDPRSSLIQRPSLDFNDFLQSREMSHPDSNVHPVATGLAKAVVDKHQEEQPLKLYAGWFCP